MTNPFLKPKVKKESAIERHLIREVVKFGGVVRKVAFPGHAGAPDRLVLFPGVSAWIELKNAVGKVSPVQMREHDLFSMMRQRLYVLRTEHEVTATIDMLYALSQRRA